MNTVTDVTSTNEFDAFVEIDESSPLSARDQQYVSQWVKGLRDLADFVEANPEWLLWNSNALRVYSSGNANEVADTARRLGSFEKRPSGSTFDMVKHFGPHELNRFFPRDAVCRKVVTGTRKVVEQRPHPDFTPVTVPMVAVEVEVEDFEYICPESLLNFDGVKAQEVA